MANELFTLGVLLVLTLAHSIGAASPLAAAHNSPDPCERFGRLFSAAVGIGAGLPGSSEIGSFKQDTLVHTRVLTDCGHQAKLKPIKDIDVVDEMLAWDELQAHDNAALAQSGQAAQTPKAACH